MFNTDLANRTLEYIREHPVEWNQNNWKDCFAGIALKLSGRVEEDHRILGTSVYDNNEFVGSVRELASDELGFSSPYDVPFGELVSYNNSLEDLEGIVAALSN